MSDFLDRFHSISPERPPQPRVFSVTARELLASLPNPRFVRLSAVDGTRFEPPLGIELISPVRPEPDYDPIGVDITVWAVRGWMFTIGVAVEGQGGLEPLLTFLEV